MGEFSDLSVVYFRLGDHICLFYRSQKELLATLVPYVRLGLERNERCFCVHSAEVKGQLVADLEASGVQAERFIESGALVFLDPQQVYFDCGRFDPDVMTELLASAIREAVQEGFSGFRAAGDMRWALEDKPGCDRLLEYEALMERFYPDKPAVGLCSYSTEGFPPGKLEQVLAVHRCALIHDHPTLKRRTLRIRNGKFFGDVAFADVEHELFHCLIQRSAGGEILSWTQERSLGEAISSVERQLHDLGHPARA
jgi:DcmR-like sensory protein